MIYNNEEYKEIPCYQGYYASASGSVYSIKRHRLLRPQVKFDGYIFYSVKLEGKQHTLQVHRAVALVWIPNPEGKLEVHHKDEDKTNNAVDNLAWVSHEENMRAGTQIQRRSRPVVLTNVTDGTKLYFKSTRDARRAGYYVDRVFSGYTKTTKGYTVEYDDPSKYL